MSTDDDYAELRLLRHTRDAQAAQIKHLTAVNERLVEQCDRYRTGANTALLVAAKTAAEFGAEVERLTAENKELRARVADNTTPVAVLADVEELTARGGYEVRRFLEIPPSNVEERIDRLMNIAFGPDPRNVKPRLRAVPRQGGAG